MGERKTFETLDPSLEKARNQTISGYVHPTSVNSCRRDARYKTFNDKGKAKKNEKFKGSNSGPAYSAIKSDKFICPVCPPEEKVGVAYSCPCVYNDMKCVNGHTWYMDRDGTVRVGDPHVKK